MPVKIGRYADIQCPAHSLLGCHQGNYGSASKQHPANQVANASSRTWTGQACCCSTALLRPSCYPTTSGQLAAGGLRGMAGAASSCLACRRHSSCLNGALAALLLVAADRPCISWGGRRLRLQRSKHSRRVKDPPGVEGCLDNSSWCRLVTGGALWAGQGAQAAKAEAC